MRRAFFVLLPLLGLTIASCAIRSGGNGVYNAPGTSYSYDRLDPDNFPGHGSGAHR